MLGAIWAQSLDGVIGNGESMPWHIPEDLAHFKEVTMGAPVVMGRRTWESLPATVRPLPGRDNTVVSSREPGDWSHGATVVSSPDDVAREGWVMGGAGLYAVAVELVDVIELTVVDCTVGDSYGVATVRAPRIPDQFTVTSDSGWLTSVDGSLLYSDVAKKQPVRYRFLRYERKEA